MSQRKLSQILLTVGFGITCGLTYQMFKYDIGADTFFNIRLPLLILAGVAFFNVVRFVEARLLRLVSGNYSAEVHRESLKTYLPLVLMILYPLQRKLYYGIWPRSLFLAFLVVSVATILVLKVDLLRRTWKEKKRSLQQPVPVLGKLTYCLALTAITVVLFWFHQLTYVFDDYYRLFSLKTPKSTYVFDNCSTRKAFTNSVNLSETIPFEQSSVTVAYKVLEFSRKALGPFNSVSFLFKLHVADEKGKVLFAKEQAVNGLDKEARKWSDIRFTISGKRKRVHFAMEVKPLLLRTDPRFLLKLLLHNPVDFSYFRNLSICTSWSEPEIVPVAKSQLNVFLISVDTLRADRLSCYGYNKDISPAIDALANDGTLYENAFSQSTWTLPSHLSMLTDKFPSELHVTTDIKWVRDTLSIPGIIKNPNVTLPEILKNRGYYCVAFTNGGFVSGYYGFYRGFHLYSERYGRGASNSFQLAQRWLSGNLDKNVFMFIHTYTVHDYTRGNEDRQESSSEEMQDSASSAPNLGEPAIKPSSYQYFQDYYDNRIKTVDADIGEFLSFMRQNNMYDNSLIIFTSDHGESFGETHNDGAVNIYGHAKEPYESQIRVPLIMKLPQGKFAQVPPRISDDVRLLDVAPTILTVLGMDIPTDFRGHAVPPVSGVKSAGPPQSVYCSSYTPSIGCIRQSNKKYIYNSENGAEEFYDLQHDPMEHHNLAGRQLAAMQPMKKEYLDFWEKIGKRGFSLKSAKVGPAAVLEQLKALGYLN